MSNDKAAAAYHGDRRTPAQRQRDNERYGYFDRHGVLHYLKFSEGRWIEATDDDS